MTVLVGVLCKDGVVVGADSAVTFAAGRAPTIEQLSPKIEVIEDHVIVAGTGAVGLGQRFTAIVQTLWTNKAFQKAPVEIGKALSAAAIADFSSTAAPKGEYGALVAFPCHNRPMLCEFGLTDFQPELKTDRLWYVSMGSGQTITDPFLGLMRKVFWRQGPPSHQDAIFAVNWAIQHAIEVNPGGVNGPINIAVLTTQKGKLSARMLSEAELAEHNANVEGAIEHLRCYPEVLRGGGAAIPDIPQPAGSAIKS